jgi:AmiR/NasT family two-component response regulator
LTKETAVKALRIVVAEDETIIRMDLRERLETLGYQVVGDASDGETALNLARQTRPDVVVMDIKMPVLDGISTAEALTKESIAPVVLVTAFSDDGLVRQASDVGVMAYVMKPLRDNDLRPAIEVAVSRYREYEILSEQVADLAERLETRKVVERAKGLLMEKHGLTERDAFQRIQKLSMDRRRTMKEIAEAVLLAEEV